MRSPANPAVFIIELTMSGPDIEKGPGPQWTCSVSSWETTGTISRTRSSASCSHGLSSRLRQTIWASEPPGFSERRMLRSAATGDMKNIGAEAREGVIVWPAQVVLLDIGREKTGVQHSGGSGILPARGDEVLRAIDADGFAMRGDLTGDGDRAVAEAAADVENALARLVQRTCEQRPAVTRKAGNQQVFETRELVEEHRVPGFHDDVVLVQCHVAGVHGCRSSS